jgi:hypothetical protein
MIEMQWLMLSMDTSAEEYLEMGTLGLLVWTRQLQDPWYREVRETYLFSSIGIRNVKYSDLADWNFRVNGNTH